MKQHNRDKNFTFVVKLFIKYKKNMILPNFILHSRKNKSWNESGIDSFNECRDREHVKTSPHPVIYQYNSRGFRDTEWPSTIEELQDCIWCVGDSFTVGVGSPLEHTWVNILQNKTRQRCINISLDGASNKWIARKVIEILKIIKPKLIVIQWSYIHRDELNDNILSDEDRRMYILENNNINELKIANFKLIQNVESFKDQCKIIHSFIPDATLLDHAHNDDLWEAVKGNSWPVLPSTLDEFNCLDKNIVNELKDFNVYDVLYFYYQLTDRIMYVPEIVRLDLARDAHHYDVITATNFVDQVENLISDLQLA